MSSLSALAFLWAAAAAAALPVYRLQVQAVQLLALAAAVGDWEEDVNSVGEEPHDARVMPWAVSS